MSLVSGGSTVGSMGSDDPLEAMKIGLELHLRPLGAGGATSWRCTPPVRQKALGAFSFFFKTPGQNDAVLAQEIFLNDLAKTTSFWARSEQKKKN